MTIDEVDFAADSFEDVVAKDQRFNARAYALLMDCVHYLGESGKHMSGEDILEEFRNRTLDQYGPLAYTVLSEWGIKCTEDVGEMMFNLTEAKRVLRDENDTAESFAGGYDFKEAFLGPYQV